MRLLDQALRLRAVEAVELVPEHDGNVEPFGLVGVERYVGLDVDALGLDLLLASDEGDSAAEARGIAGREELLRVGGARLARTA